VCSHYQAIKEHERYLRHFGVAPPTDVGKHDLWPGYSGTFIRRHPHADVGDEAMPTCIRRKDGAPMGIAGLWSRWTSPKGDVVHSYTMLTINAEDHPLMRLMHKPTDEKRMVVILPDAAYGDWLTASAEHSHAFMRPYPADALVATAPKVDGGLF